MGFKELFIGFKEQFGDFKEQFVGFKEQFGDFKEQYNNFWNNRFYGNLPQFSLKDATTFGKIPFPK
jgi:hypothetical protein